MIALRDTAKAKLNLTLEVLGRRADGYHALESLVAFAALGDAIALEPAGALSLAVEGPFAEALTGDNLILKAAEAAKAAQPGLRLGRFRLIKTLPVAAGLGGGSADAAAALRLLAEANPGALSEATLAAIAASLGSDIKVCLASRAAVMFGRGEHVVPVAAFPACAVVLVNPRLPLATAEVFARLKAPLLARTPDDPVTPDLASGFDRLAAYATARGNDLEPPALALAPVIGEVLRALTHLPGARLGRLSGSGPTCFALFRTLSEAERAARLLAAIHPEWWVAPAALG